jgi:Mlc titration factor MtfA (ptsG expression regulator)
MFFPWSKNRRRHRLLAEPFPAERLQLLRRRVRHFQHLPAAQQDRVRAIVQVMLAEKDWAAAAGFEVTEEMRVTIAGYAAVMVSGLDEPYFYDQLQTVVVHADTLRFSQNPSVVNPLANEPTALDGIILQRGPVVISWAAVRDERRGASTGDNVVIHEFAHHLDGLNGSMDGTPPLPPEAEKRWLDVADQEREWLEEDGRRGSASLLDHNGAASPAEFFAVASERFFELPHQLRRRHPDLYEELAGFYRQDPTQWLPR